MFRVYQCTNCTHSETVSSDMLEAIGLIVSCPKCNVAMEEKSNGEETDEGVHGN